MSGKWQKPMSVAKSSKSKNALISAGSDSPTSCAISSCCPRAARAAHGAGDANGHGRHALQHPQQRSLHLSRPSDDSDGPIVPFMGLMGKGCARQTFRAVRHALKIIPHHNLTGSSRQVPAATSPAKTVVPRRSSPGLPCRRKSTPAIIIANFSPCGLRSQPTSNRPACLHVK